MKGRPAIIFGGLFAAGLMLMAVTASVADDPLIRGALLRQQVWATIDDYLLAKMPDGTMRLYDPIENRVLRLEIRDLHERFVRNSDFYIRCVDFVDQAGRKIDVDFLVLHTEKPMLVTQAIVHKIDGVERKYVLSESFGSRM